MLSLKQARLFLSLTPEEQRARIAKLSPEELLGFDGWFEFWAHRGQLPPLGEGWRVWLMMAGRGFGKTRAGAEWIYRLALSRPVRIALVGATIEEARSVMVEGVSGVLSVARLQRHRVKWEPSLGQISWTGGSVAKLFSATMPTVFAVRNIISPGATSLPNGVRPKGRGTICRWDFERECGQRALVTTTPRSLPLLKRIKQDDMTICTGGKTNDNINLPDSFVDAMMSTYAGTRLGRQELDGELIADVEGSLWPRELIERSRSEAPEQFDRIVVGVDPPAGAGEGCDACGIVVAGRREGRLFVIADETCQGLSPEGWANRVAWAVERWDADIVVAEANNGGAMVGSVLKAAEVGVRVKLVHASRGKVARAEPIALRFESGRAFLAGSFPQLEDELSGLTTGGGYEGPSRSPDRADAMVWAMTELGETRSGVPRVRAL